MSAIPALSLRQPWLWAIFELGKSLENRRWNTSRRGPIWLHASAGMTRQECVDALGWMLDAGVRGQKDFPGLKLVERGGVCGYAEIVDVLRPLPPMPGSGENGFCDLNEIVEQHGRYLKGFAEASNCVTRDEIRWWMQDQYAFVLRNVRRFPLLPCKGSLGFFHLPPEVERAAIAAIEGTCPCESGLEHIGPGHIDGCRFSNPEYVE